MAAVVSQTTKPSQFAGNDVIRWRRGGPERLSPCDSERQTVTIKAFSSQLFTQVVFPGSWLGSWKHDAAFKVAETTEFTSNTATLEALVKKSPRSLVFPVDPED